MKIDMKKKYTSHGKPTRILCTDRPSDSVYPVIGMRDDGSIAYFTEEGKSILGSSYNLIEVWEPQEGEWCWFWNKGDSNSLNLAKIIITPKSKKFYSYGLHEWDCCAKFDGTFPEHLKENK
jgi:hypothetical protein